MSRSINVNIEKITIKLIIRSLKNRSIVLVVIDVGFR